MTNLRGEIEKILAQVLMKHHDDISKQDEDAIAEAADQILQMIESCLPKEKEYNPQNILDEEIHLLEAMKRAVENSKAKGFNSCLAQIRERMGER